MGAAEAARKLPFPSVCCMFRTVGLKPAVSLAEACMGHVFADITLKNAGDVNEVRRGHTAAQEVRETAVRAMVDTGAGSLVINEWVQARLGLEVVGLRRVTLGNNTKEICKVTEPVEVHWKDRQTTCPALVIPGDGSVLLGVIPLEDMDLVVDPTKQQLAGAHGDEVISLVM
jgi:clan AA aspartic protease